MPAMLTMSLALCSLVALARAGVLESLNEALSTDNSALISILGEKVVLSWLSHSTSWPQVLLFASLPIGIIGFLVSAIRVGGPQWLRTAIGRPREPKAIVEAEVMPTVSREVSDMSGDITVGSAEFGTSLVTNTQYRQGTTYVTNERDIGIPSHDLKGRIQRLRDQSAFRVPTFPSNFGLSNVPVSVPWTDAQTYPRHIYASFIAAIMKNIAVQRQQNQNYMDKDSFVDLMMELILTLVAELPDSELGRRNDIARILLLAAVDPVIKGDWTSFT